MKRLALDVRQAALDEAATISAWYEEQQPGLGNRFLLALDACFDDLMSSPFRQMRKEPFRYASIKDFPHYRVVFAIDRDVITVYQVRHTSRKPHPKYGP